MRYLHPVQAHERFLASGCYRFIKNGQALAKTELWTIHAHPDGETFLRVDLDARAEEGKSILAEALQDRDNHLARLDISYQNAQFEGGVKDLRATYQVAEGRLHVGFALNGAERDYIETDLPAGTLIDVPLLIFRGRTIMAMVQGSAAPLSIYVPMFEYAQLFPGALQQVHSPVEYMGDDRLVLGQREVSARRYHYRDKAAAYWIDDHGVIVKRVNVFNGQEIVVQISNYAAAKS